MTTFLNERLHIYSAANTPASILPISRIQKKHQGHSIYGPFLLVTAGERDSYYWERELYWWCNGTWYDDAGRIKGQPDGWAHLPPPRLASDDSPVSRVVSGR